MIWAACIVNRLGSIVTEVISDFAMACLSPKSPNLHFPTKALGPNCMAEVGYQIFSKHL